MGGVGVAYHTPVGVNHCSIVCLACLSIWVLLLVTVGCKTLENKIRRGMRDKLDHQQSIFSKILRVITVQ